MDVETARLVMYIADHSGARPDELAERYGVSSRTVRNHVHAANRELAPIARLELPRGGGYQLVVDDEAAFGRWVERQRGRDRQALPQTPEARVSYLLNDLLSRNDYITLDALAGILFVSRASISNDLKQVEARLLHFGLTLEKRPHHGIRVIGSEMARRLCLASLAMDVADGPLAAGTNDVDVDERRELLDVVSSCVERVTAEERFSVNSMAYRNLVTHIAIAILRMRAGCYVPMETEQLATIKRSAAFPIAGRVAHAIGAATGMSLPEEEVAYIAIHLASKHLIEGDGSSSGEGAKNLEITDEAWNLAAEMLDVVWRAFRFDFRDDAELRMNLARHLMPLEVRLKYGMVYDNPLLPDIKARYPLPFSMATDALGVLGERHDTAVSDAEIGYVALFFALALERRHTGHAKRHVLVVCASGAGSARLLAYRLQEEFSSDFERVDTCDASDFSTRDLTDIDYIFTTVPLERAVEQPVVHISLFLDETSRRDVKRALKQDSDANIKSYFSRDLFFPHCALTTHEEIIDFLCERCSAYDELPENFEALVWQRERAANTSFGNLVALPHPYEAVSSKTFVAVVLTDAPVDWGGTPVQAVFMVCVARDAGADLEAFYRAMTGLLTKQQAIQELIDDMRFEVLLSELEGE